MIQKMDGHLGEIWSMSVSEEGGLVLTGSHDRSLRLWERTEEPLYIEEEKEKELENLLESSLANNDGADMLADPRAAETRVAAKQTMESLRASERIVEAIDIGEQDWAMQEFTMPRLQPVALPSHIRVIRIL